MDTGYTYNEFTTPGTMDINVIGPQNTPLVGRNLEQLMEALGLTLVSRTFANPYDTGTGLEYHDRDIPD